jgi:hypothetical protein
MITFTQWTTWEVSFFVQLAMLIGTIAAVWYITRHME